VQQKKTKHRFESKNRKFLKNHAKVILQKKHRFGKKSRGSE
jgi:hypothetical protein